jgi:multiple sugar transport system permease protein
MNRANHARPLRAPIRRIHARLWLYLVVLLGGALMALPFYYMVVTSFKRLADVSKIPLSLGLERPTLEAYEALLDGFPYGLFVLNSLVVAISTTAGSMVLCSLAGYAFAKHQFRYKEPLFWLLLSTMLIPHSVLLVPGFLLMRDLGWLNSFWPLIVPNLGGAFGVFLSRQFIAEIPDALLDAARIDGCNDWQVFWKVIMPLSKPLLATLGILTFLSNWNSFVGPLIYLIDEKLFTLPLALSLLQGRYTATENVQMAGAALAVIPVLLVFLLFQKQIVKSLTTSGLKG